MEQIVNLYYKRFIEHVIAVYRPILETVKMGHCMKLTGLAERELLILLPLLREINDQLEVYILSEDNDGAFYIHATKLIELRNDPNRSILILVPSDSVSSAAEDSYGDATFQNLSVAELQTSFYNHLRGGIPQDKEYIWKQIEELLDAEVKVMESAKIYYLLYLDLYRYQDSAWGDGLWIFGILPDRELVKNGENIRRRFLINYEKVSLVLGNFSMSVSDRIASLPLKKDTQQRALMTFLTEEKGIDDKVALFENIHDKHQEFNFASLPWVLATDNQKIKVEVELVPGKDSKKELIIDDSGDYMLSIPTDKKGKVSFKVTITPSPKDNPDIFQLEIAMVNIDDFSEEGVIKKTKIGTNKRATRKLSVNIANGMFEDGRYMLRVRALDENGIVLDNEKIFKEENIQMAWEEALAKNPSLQIEQYRIDERVAFCNESDAFTIDNTGEAVESEDKVDKRVKVNSFTQAIMHYRSSHLSKGEELDIPEDVDLRNKWEEGNLNDTYHFDFGASYAYQIQLSKKLMQIERTFLRNSSRFGHVEVLLSGNLTDVQLLDPIDTANRSPRFVEAVAVDMPDDLVNMRKNLFDLIKSSAEEDLGLICTFDITKNIGEIRSYLDAYDAWLREELDKKLDESAVIAIQNLDTVNVMVEMPDGTLTTIKLITPLHPLRLAWMINLYELYQDWEERTLENAKYRKAWYRKLDKLFQGKLLMDIAPAALCDNAMNEAYQYIGELTWGWGMYVKPSMEDMESFASGNRQLKAYTASLFNVSKEKCVDSDVSKELVVKHLQNYVLSHPYTNKIVINLFNAGDAMVFSDALVELERMGLGINLRYEIRLFSNDNMLQSGESFKDLLDPELSRAVEMEAFSQASTNRLFPKLRFSLNKISDFVNSHDKYQAHISFLVNPFAVDTELVRPDKLSRSFYLNGTICRSVVNAMREGKSYVWNRYYSNKTMLNPVSEVANTEVNLFSHIQEVIGRLLSSTHNESVPATTLRLKEGDMMLLSFVHDCSDWVITFDKNMGPEFYDLPCGDNEVPYLLDYIPSDGAMGVSSYLTTKPTSEIGALMIPLFKKYGIDIENKENFKLILEDVRSVSSSMIMQVNTTQQKGFEVIGTTLAKRFLDKKGISQESFLIPIDLHKEFFEELETESKRRADDLVVKIDVQKREILFTIVEIKCRNASYQVDDLHLSIVEQIENTKSALRSHFEMSVDGEDRLDRELKVLELKSLLEFYIQRSCRYGQLDPELANDYILFLSKLSEGYTIRFKELGIIFDFNEQERQKKTYIGDAVIYTMGQPIIDDILDENVSIETRYIDQTDEDFVQFFEPTFRREEESVDKKKEDRSRDKEEKQDGGEETPAVEIEIPENKKDEESKKIDVEVRKPIDNVPNPLVGEIKENLGDYTSVNEIKGPKYDVIIGSNNDSPQYGILGKMVSQGRVVGLDLNECNTISLFGVQGAGKSYTIGSITEMVLNEFAHVNKLPSPMASVIFHYSDSMDYAPEFTSMVYPNDDARQLEKLKLEYGAEPNSIKDVILLAPQSQIENRKREYPDIEVYPIGFDSGELTVKDWMFLLGAMGNDSTYIKELKQIMKSCRNNMSLVNIRHGVAVNNHFSQSQKILAEQRLDFASEYITDGVKLKNHLCPGRLIIVDLRDEFIGKDEALGLFVVMLNIFSSVKEVDNKAFNKFIVFDEAHKYMNDKDLVDSITTSIREMRHKGVSVMIASQDPMSLPTEIIELSSIVVMHRFSSPQWVKYVQKAITPLQTLTASEMASLGSGEAYIWANKSSDKGITQRPIKINIRPRVTKHGGDTIQAVKK